jgi:hypothetical protein
VFHEPLPKHTLRYMCATIDWGLSYPSGKYLRECSKTSSTHLALYTDSDHFGEDTKRSNSGWAVKLHGCLIAWGSKLQATAVGNTCATEFVAAGIGENAMMNLKNLFFEITGKNVDAELLVDNQSAVDKLNRPVGGNMWLDLKWRVVHQRKLVKIRYIPTIEQVADILTKSLTPIFREKAVRLLRMYCDKLKAVEYENAQQRATLLKIGVVDNHRMFQK